MRETISISSSARSYTVEFIDDLAVLTAGIDFDRSFVVCDAAIVDLYRDALAPVVASSRFLAIEANEEAKTLKRSQELVEILIESSFRRGHRLIALGGGVTQDLTSFTASVLFRGTEWVFVPTTLLAQSDSCIGSKTSINLGAKKNVLGSFWPPSSVFIAPHFLASLPVDQIKSGIGEIMHFYIYADSPLLPGLMADYEGLLERRELLAPYVRESLAIKKGVIEKDELDQGERNLFNYGHTFGHALESLTNYRINHGQAVTFGMDLANFVSCTIGMMAEDAFDRLHAMLTVNMPEISSVDWNTARYLDFLAADKKNTDQQLTCILARGPGALEKMRIPIDGRLETAIETYLSVHHR